MDLIAQIEALTVGQLTTLAKRDDATGILAEYRLAALTNSPAPSRETVVMGEGYAIVAANGELKRLEVDGYYATSDDAEDRLEDIRYFENAVIREGSFVSWNSSGGRARGKVQRILQEGSVKVPGTSFTINAEPDNPAVLIRLWRKTADGWNETDTVVGHKMSTLTSIESLSKESFEPPLGVQESGQQALDWIAGGPIVDDEPLELAKAKFVRKSDDRQFTLGPLYVPDFMDAHGEWTDPDTLQNAVWGWVNSGDRRIFLQHNRDVEAGNWVEVMTMPQAWTVDMYASDGSVAGEVTYPAGTVFLGVIWNDESWAKIKRGELRGYSIGGMSGSVYAEMPDNAIREGVEVTG